MQKKGLYLAGMLAVVLGTVSVPLIMGHSSEVTQAEFPEKSEEAAFVPEKKVTTESAQETSVEMKKSGLLCSSNVSELELHDNTRPVYTMEEVNQLIENGTDNYYNNGGKDVIDVSLCASAFSDISVANAVSSDSGLDSLENKSYIYHMMLNSVDYFDTAKGSVTCAVDLNMPINAEFSTNIPESYAYENQQLSNGDIIDTYVYDGMIYNVTNNELCDSGYWGEPIEFDLSGINREIISNGTYPKYIMLNFRGTDKDVFDKINSEYPPEPSLIGGNGYAGSDVKIYYNNAEIYIDNELHTLMVFLKVNAWNSVTKPFYFRILIIFLLAVLVIAFLDAWRKNVRNQAEYMFEDYQTNLTNSLAHDLKTPLTAIGGYTENILSGSLSDTETTNYLNSIMESVAYTDSIITRTLELNRMNQLKEPQRQNNSIHTIIEKTIEKYSVMLDERNITVTTDGQAEISANTHLLETALENLVSNAVKYTSGNGNINIKISPERLVISNSVKQKTNVEKLKKPFAKGDDTRSNQSGSGLGLSIAETALLINGFRLSLSCTDSEFTTEIRF